MAALQKAATARIEELLRVEVTRACVDLEPYKRVTGYRVWREPLPRTRLGKIRRFQLSALYERAERAEAPKPKEPTAEDKALLADPISRTIIDILKRRFSGMAVELDTSLQLDLSVDSLSWIEIAHEIEASTGRSIQEDAIASIVTIRDLIKTVQSATPTAAPIVVAVALPPPRKAWTTPLAWGFYWFLRILMRTAFRLEIRGRPPAGDTQTLIAVNHLSDLDPPIVAAALPWKFIGKVRWGADVNRVFDTAIKRAFARFAQVFPVDDRKPAETLAYAKAALAEGTHLIWFPESWRSPDGKLQQFSRGVGIMVMDRRPTVVPARIEGTFEALPRHKTFPRLTRVRIAFGEPIAPAEFEPCGGAADPAAAAAALIRERLEALDARAGSG
jgi:long-chain acyl-CoA synthetase